MHQRQLIVRSQQGTAAEATGVIQLPVSHRTRLSPQNFGLGRPPMNYSFRYWTAFDRWLLAHGSELRIIEPVDHNICGLYPESDSFSMSCGGVWYMSGKGEKQGLVVMVKLKGDAVSIYDQQWMPKRKKIEAEIGNEMSWAVFRPDLRYVTVRLRGPDFRDNSQQEEHFAWFAETATRMRQVLFGDMPLDVF